MNDQSIIPLSQAVETVESQSTIAIVESSKDTSFATDECSPEESTVATAELQIADNKIDIFH
jgi:hypothetical protein